MPPKLSQESAGLTLEPFLHFDASGIYNPLSNRKMTPADGGFQTLLGLRDAKLGLEGLSPEQRQDLVRQDWLIEDDGNLGDRFRLKYVSMEANEACNQACYFCPVSTDPRGSHNMTMAFYEDIVRQLAAHRATIEGVSTIHYNEPTIDPLFLERLAMLRHYDLPTAVLSNGTGLTPKRIDRIAAMGGLCYLSINLSTLDGARYAAERGRDHLDIVLRNLEYLKNHRISPQMDIVVLGCGDDQHKDDYERISARFADTVFEIKYYEVMDRAGNAAVGQKPSAPHKRLCGCEQTGSRPLQWVHITSHGKCVLCCQDYHDRYVVGDLNEQSLDEVLAGPAMARMRRWVYGLEQAPDDFICRSCVYARTR